MCARSLRARNAGGAYAGPVVQSEEVQIILLYCVDIPQGSKGKVRSRIGLLVSHS